MTAIPSAPRAQADSVAELSYEEFQAMRAAIQYHRTEDFEDGDFKTADLFRYVRLLRSSDYQEWIARQAWAFWRERQSTEQLIADYMRRCEEAGSNLANSEDETSERMCWRADGAADALEHILQELRNRGRQ
jgi:hypothetical protein